MESSLQIPDLTEDLSQISDNDKAKMLNWILEYHNRFSEIEKLDQLLREQVVLRKGRQFLRATSDYGVDFNFPMEENIRLNSIIAWSVILDEKEILCAINMDSGKEGIAYVTIDNSLHALDSKMHCLYASAPCPQELNVEARNGRAIRLTIPASGFVIYG